MLHQLLEERLEQVVRECLPDAPPGAARVRPCPDPRFGDYQSAALMALARERKLNPRQLAEQVRARLRLEDLCAAVEVAGPGFLNFRVRPEAVAGVLERALRGEHLFYTPACTPRTVVVDFSSPNVAKPMHVGHIRSTILGDCLARVLRRLGCRVITDNHLGDWGTQFGMLLTGWKEALDAAALERAPLLELERLYQAAHAACASNPAALERARRELVRLQAGDPENLAVWREMTAHSRREFDAVYQRLGVRFDETLGESFYQPRLNGVVAELRAAGLARQSEGATVVFFDDAPALKDHPALILKSDGAANYTTTDLATLAYRLERWAPDEIVYVTDGRQQLHFQQLFAIFRRWRPAAKVHLAHVWFGSILGPDGTPFKTRAGGTVKLADLLDEAEQRAGEVVRAKNPELSPEEQRAIGRVVGLGALKYADLLPNRQSDYVFDWDKMLALSGNTAVYLLYAYTRIRSIFRKLPGGSEAAADTGNTTAAVAADGGDDGVGATASAGRPGGGGLSLGAPEELRLAKHLLNFGLVLEAVAEEYRPNYLCNYLFELAGHFTSFYEQCPVLKAAEPQRGSRLKLCELTGRVLRAGLESLGLETTEKM